jgi:hypothetical protein
LIGDHWRQLIQLSLEYVTKVDTELTVAITDIQFQL